MSHWLLVVRALVCTMAHVLPLRDVLSYTLIQDDGIPSKRVHVIANRMPSGCRILWEFRYLHFTFTSLGLKVVRWKWWQPIGAHLASKISVEELRCGSRAEGMNTFGTVSTTGLLFTIVKQMDQDSHKTPPAIKSRCVEYLQSVAGRVIEVVRLRHPGGCMIAVGQSRVVVLANGTIGGFVDLLPPDDPCVPLLRSAWHRVRSDGIHGTPPLPVYWINMGWVLCFCSRALLVCEQHHVCGNPPLPVYGICTVSVMCSCPRALLLRDPKQQKRLRQSPLPVLWNLGGCSCSRALLVFYPKQQKTPVAILPSPLMEPGWVRCGVLVHGRCSKQKSVCGNPTLLV